MTEDQYRKVFAALTGNENGHFPWQWSLYDDWFSKGKIPESCNLPTGLGKTSVIAVWLIAYANGAKVPRRLVYVVNRRTVVDQTTDEVEKYRRNLSAAGIKDSLALSTLRGQFADNREWSEDPSRPAVICGTVDMIGSRLLFSGYGVGAKAKPLHAGFLGQDALLVHDEAHLEPIFQTLIEAIRDEQGRCNDFRPLRVMELTATSRGTVKPFELTAADREDATVRERVTATKRVHLHELADPKKLAEQITLKAAEYADKGRAVVVFARTVDDVMKVAGKLPKGRVVTLTGTMRGKERDDLVEDSIFRRFLPGNQSDEPSVFLVCTSAGEVGVNLSADHLVSDLSTFDSMAQRFGRVNRFGKRKDTEIHVIHPADDEFEEDDYEQRRQRTLQLLRELDGDGSPDAIGRLDPDARRNAFAPTPKLLTATDILFDAWALTGIPGKLPGRPSVEPYLHGLPTSWQPPETQVAWREEVEELQPEYETDAERKERQAVDRKSLAKLAIDLLDDFPLKPHEQLRDNMTRVRAALDTLAEKQPDAPAWLVDETGEVTVTSLAELAETEKREGKTAYRLDSRYGTILLPPSIGGLSAQGMLDPKADLPATDVSCEWFEDKERTRPRRARTESEEPPDGMRLVRRLALPGGGEEDEPAYWYWYARGGDDDRSKSAREPVTLERHVTGVTNALRGIASRLFSAEPEWVDALVRAAEWHDLGKRREVWQRSIGNPRPKEWYAKSGKDPQTGKLWKPTDLTGYRHEFGSLLDLLDHKQSYRPDFDALSSDMQELVLHLIAAHHGRARPHFPPDEAFDPNPGDADTVARDVPQRFARLQRKYGRWGLAYLESLLRAADWAASAKPLEFAEDNK